jgi:hypothetical protein
LKEGDEESEAELEYEEIDINIEDMEIGNEVLSFNESTGKLEWKKILNTFERKNNKLIVLKLSNGIKIKSTPEHRFYEVQLNDWIEATYLKVGMKLLDTQLKEIKIEEISEEIGEVEVYNFEVQDNHNYFAEGVLVHNKYSDEEGQQFNKNADNAIIELKTATLPPSYSSPEIIHGNNTIVNNVNFDLTAVDLANLINNNTNLNGFQRIDLTNQINMIQSKYQNNEISYNKSTELFNNIVINIKLIQEYNSILQNQQVKQAKEYAANVKNTLLIQLASEFSGTVLKQPNRPLEIIHPASSILNLSIEGIKLFEFKKGNKSVVTLPRSITNPSSSGTGKLTIPPNLDPTAPKYNLDNWFLEQMNTIANSEQMDFIKKNNDKAEGWAGFFTMNDNQGPWDMKEYISRGRVPEARNDYELGGYTFPSDVPGNVIFGYIGAAGGFSENSLLAGGGYAQFDGRYSSNAPLDAPKDASGKPYKDGVYGTNWSGIGDTTSNYDDPRDQAAIKAGYKLFQKCGNNCSAQDLHDTLSKYVDKINERPKNMKPLSERPI